MAQTVKHVLLLKFKDSVSDAEKVELIQGYQALPSLIPHIKAFEWYTLLSVSLSLSLSLSGNYRQICQDGYKGACLHVSLSLIQWIMWGLEGGYDVCMHASLMQWNMLDLEKDEYCVCGWIYVWML